MAQGLRPSRSQDPVTAATKASLSSLAHRVADLEEEIIELDARIIPLLKATAPELLAVYSVGIDTAATLLVAAGDNPERLHSEAAWAHLCGVSPLQASSGKVTRHRLNRGGDRQANRALWHIVITRLASVRRPRPTWNTGSKMVAPSAKPSAFSSAMSPARSTAICLVARFPDHGLGSQNACRPSGLTSSRSAGPRSGFTEFAKTRDLIRACPPTRVAHHWSVRCPYSRKLPQK